MAGRLAKATTSKNIMSEGTRMLHGETAKEILNKEIKEFSKNIKNSQISDSPVIQNILAGKVG
jgi:hypothetical protein